MENRKFCKIEKEEKVAGVCAGIAYYFDVDVTMVRFIWAMAVIFGVGSPILIYIVLAVILPNYDPDTDIQTPRKKRTEEDPYDDSERY